MKNVFAPEAQEILHSIPRFFFGRRKFLVVKQNVRMYLLLQLKKYYKMRLTRQSFIQSQQTNWSALQECLIEEGEEECTTIIWEALCKFLIITLKPLTVILLLVQNYTMLCLTSIELHRA